MELTAILVILGILILFVFVLGYIFGIIAGESNGEEKLSKERLGLIADRNNLNFQQSQFEKYHQGVIDIIKAIDDKYKGSETTESILSALKQAKELNANYDKLNNLYIDLKLKHEKLMSIKNC